MDTRVRVTRSRNEEGCSPFNVFPWASGHSTAIKSKEDATRWRSWHSPMGVDRGEGVSSRRQCGQSKAGQWEHMVAEGRKGQQGLPRRNWAAEPFTRR